MKPYGTDDYSSWWNRVPPKSGPSRQTIVDRLKTYLADAHYRHGHGAGVHVNDKGELRQYVNSMAACPECQRLSVELTYRRKARPVEELFRR